MHLFKNSVSFIAIMCVCGAAYSATPGRVGMNVGAAGAARRAPATTASMRTPTLTTGAATVATQSTATTNLLSASDCIDDYRDCIKGESACGPEFEECTTNVLFHGRMTECFSTLIQCPSDAIQKLMGTSDTTALSKVESKDGDEVTRYTYPTDGSIMGMDIIGAATRNKLSTADCVKKYKKCLNKDTICGEDFELCTSDDEFKRQAAMCDSTLARCQKEGFQQLFGEAVTSKPANKKLKPNADGDIRHWIDDGATLAASNAVNTCYKVVDNCFLNACAKNPYRCVEGVSFNVMNAADFIGEQGGSTSLLAKSEVNTETQSAAEVRKFFRAACQDTIGSNKYCFMTFKEKTPGKKDLTDPDTREEIFDEAYTTRNKKDIIGTKLTDVLEKFDKTAKDKCVDTFKSCAVRSCGGGSGAACYARVFGNKDMSGSINKAIAYPDIERGCSAVINTDANCKYMAATQSESDNTYNYSYDNSSAFGILFPKYEEAGDKAIIVAALNADLSTSYNDAAIEKMKKGCSNVVTNCVKSMCGKDYQNCYRNRNDVKLATYSTDSSKFNASMNKVGGVLDYTIVQGLCAMTVKNSDACAESLAIAKLGVSDFQGSGQSSWGSVGSSTTLSSAWRGSADNYNATSTQVQEEDDLGRKLCTCANGGKGVCGEEDNGDVNCTTKSMVSSDYALTTKATNNLFQEVLADIELEAQAKYNAKLTKEQNICLAQNNGANPDAAFVWAKTKGKLPANYQSHGLGADGSIASNDLYNSFCRMKVTMMSEDKDVQQLLSGGSIKVADIDSGGLLTKDTTYGTYTGGNDSVVYFAAGDPFTCGSWISEKTLEAISKKLDHDARVEAGEGSQHDKNVKLWTTLGAAAVGGVGMDLLQTKTGLGGLLGTSTKKQESSLETCVEAVSTATDKLNEARNNPDNSSKLSSFRSAANKALSAARDAGVDVSGIKFTGTTTSDGTKADGYEWTEFSKRTAAAKTYQACVETDGVETNVKQAAQNVLNWLDKQNPDSDVSAITDDENKVRQSQKSECQKVLSLSNLVKTKTGTSSKVTPDWADYQANLTKLESRCSEKRDGKDKNFWNNGGGRAVMDVAGAGVTAVLANGIVSTAQKAKYEQAGNEAVKKWMDEIGKKIHCYVGGTKVGDFGEIITIDISDEQ